MWQLGKGEGREDKADLNEREGEELDLPDECSLSSEIYKCLDAT